MTTTVTVRVPEGASYVARVTAFHTASRHETDVQPGAEQVFYASSSCSLQVVEVVHEAPFGSPAVGAATMAFGDAIRALKEGKRVCRAGWNGKGMWLALTQGTPNLPADKFWNPHNRAFAEQNGGTATVLPSITMKTATGEILMGWLASQTDMLAEDWMVLSADAA